MPRERVLLPLGESGIHPGCRRPSTSLRAVPLPVDTGEDQTFAGAAGSMAESAVYPHPRSGGGGPCEAWGGGVRAPTVTMKRARAFRREPALPEVLLWRDLRGSRLDEIRFRRQHPPSAPMCSTSTRRPAAWPWRWTGRPMTSPDGPYMMRAAMPGCRGKAFRCCAFPRPTSCRTKGGRTCWPPSWPRRPLLGASPASRRRTGGRRRKLLFTAARRRYRRVNIQGDDEP